MRMIEGPSKLAASSRMFVVSSVISLSALPMTPPMADPPSASPISSISVESVRSVPSRVSERLARPRPANDDAATAHPIEVEGVQRLADGPHDVVGDVDDVVDRTHARVGQPCLEPGRRLADRHPPDDPGRVPRAQVGVEHFDGDIVGDVPLALGIAAGCGQARTAPV